MSEVRVSEVIAPAFHDVHRAIRDHTHTHFWLKGGRGSTKSSFAAIECVLLVLRNPTVNVVVVRKVANTLRDSVYAQVQWAIEILGCSGDFAASVSPMEIVYKPTGQRILFRGADKPEKLKSIKTRIGYVGVIWYEELDQFYGMAEIRSINQSLMRGGDAFWAFYTYNPPKSRDSWANREALTHRDDRLVHESTYLDVPRHWLGEQFIAEAEELERTKPDAYRHEYLGDVTGTGGAVFENVRVEAITDEQLAEFDHVHNGLDWGYFPDPWCFVRCHYDTARSTLYVFDEATAVRQGNAETATIVRERLTYADARDKEPTYHYDSVTCDSAEPKSISDYRDHDIDARPARKGPGSVEHGMKWLQALDAIVIDPQRCPTAAAEFTLYEYERTKDGEYCSGFPDANNHAIDAVRYAMSTTIQRRYSS